MAKNKEKITDAVNREKKVTEKKPVEATLSLVKYFQLVNPPIHIYTRAYLGEQFRGVIKTKAQWNDEMEIYLNK